MLGPGLAGAGKEGVSPVPNPSAPRDPAVARAEAGESRPLRTRVLPYVWLEALQLFNAALSFGFFWCSELREPGAANPPLYGMLALFSLIPIVAAFLLSRNPERSGSTLAFWVIGLLVPTWAAAIALSNAIW